MEKNSKNTQTKTPQKPRSRHKPTSGIRVNRKKSKIDAVKERELHELFLMNGMSAYQAAKIVKVDFETAKIYFRDWADELIESEGHETWSERQMRVRARAVEGIVKLIIQSTKRLKFLQKTYDALTTDKAMKNNPNHALIKSYGAQIVEATLLLQEQNAQKFCIETAEPADAILDREIEKAIAERNRITE